MSSGGFCSFRKRLTSQIDLVHMCERFRAHANAFSSEDSEDVGFKKGKYK